MKGGLCALSAARAILDAGVPLRGSLRIQSVIAEEDGGAGTLAAILRGHSGDGAVVLEPTRLAVAPAQAGALTFRVTVPGRAAHGAFREEGVDPIEKSFPLFQRLRELEAERNRQVADPLYAGDELPFPLAVGKVRAGIWASTVAESLTFEGRLGVAPGEAPARARRALEAALAEAAAEDPWLRDHPPEVEWPGAQFDPARTPVDSPIVRALGDAYRSVTGVEPEVRGMRYGADMRLLVNEAGIPTLLFGPGDVREAHRPDESVPIPELLTAARVLAIVALRFCGAGMG
jgi:acetylornithine deacetylase